MEVFLGSNTVSHRRTRPLGLDIVVPGGQNPTIALFGILRILCRSILHGWRDGMRGALPQLSVNGVISNQRGL